MLIPQLLAKMRITVSMAEGRRAIGLGAVKFNNQPVDLDTQVEPKVGDTLAYGRTTFTIQPQDLENGDPDST